MNRRAFTSEYLTMVARVIESLPADALEDALLELEAAGRRGATVFLAGNGGSAATANHMANDLMLGTAKDGGRGFRVQSLSANVSVLTALANDEGFDQAFAGQLRTWGEAGDVLLVITGSGNSPNIVRACEDARAKGMRVVGLLGKDGGQARPLCDVAVVVPSHDYGVIEAIHLVVDHLFATWFCTHARVGEPALPGDRPSPSDG